MPTPTKGPRLGGSSAHQRHILANLATALFEHGKITTTEAKARRLRPFAERLITFAKRGDLHARREVLTVVTEIGPSFAARDGGYTRITKVGPRKGDNAPLAVIELVPEEATASPRRRRARRAQPAAASRAARPAAGTAAAEETATAEDAATAGDTTAVEDTAAVDDTAEAEAEDTAAEAEAEDTAEAAAPDAEDAAGEDAGDGAEDDGK